MEGKKLFLSCLRHHNFLQITKVAEKMLDLLGRIIYLNSTHFLQEKTWNSLDEKPWMKDMGHNPVIYGHSTGWLSIKTWE